MNLERIIFLFIVALPIGLVLEGAFALLSPLFLQAFIPNIAEIMNNDNIIWQVMKFGVFHVLGWLLGRELADAVEQDPDDEFCEELESYVFEKDGHLIEVNVY